MEPWVHFLFPEVTVRFTIQRVFLFLLAPFFSVNLSAALAPMSASAKPEVRYHYGDNAAWADPNFDESSWTVAPGGLFRLPPFHSDGIVWIRFNLPVPTDSAAGASLWLVNPHATAEQVFLDGKLIGQTGELPPNPKGVLLPVFTVLDAVGMSQRASFATVALRLWYPPGFRYRSGEDHIACELGSTAVLKERQRAERLSLILSWVPLFSLDGLLVLLGIGLLGLWLWLRGRELFWFALLLVFYPLGSCLIDLPAITPLRLAFNLRAFLLVAGNVPMMFVTVKCLWTLFDLRARPLSIVLHASWITWNAVGFLTLIATKPSPAIAWMAPIGIVSLTVFNLGTLLVELRYLVTGPTRGIAAGMAVIPIGSGLNLVGLPPIDLFGVPHLDLFHAGLFSAGIFLSVMLARRAFAEWHVGTRLRVEFAAAREVQQRLVPAALPPIDRFQIEAAYLPAQEVGGDFYQVLPRKDGSTLIVIGDVSGKGLKAAMTGTLALGALRSLAQEPLGPAQMLSRLNAQLAASSNGGFITCLCILSSPDGILKLANAGHLPPYQNGEEVALDSGLPLGIAEQANYAESILALAPGDRLTLVSDGIVEAQSPTRELFGFERTAAISTQSAEAIAAAAKQFGQEDDITVLTLTFAPVEVLHA
jgi:phosphoserine phosphatase RsbU/P